MFLALAMHPTDAPRAQPAQSVELPTPDRTGTMSVERALDQRRSVRAYQREAMALDDVSQLLWAAQGITHANGYRTAPSAGALYPLELHVVAGRVEGLAPGVYRYRPGGHMLVTTERRDRRADLARAALDQSWVQAGAIAVVITAVYERTARKYGERAPRYAHIEAGHVAQNIYLQATTRNLGTVIVGAFDDADVKAVLNLPDGEEPLAIMPVGQRRQ